MALGIYTGAGGVKTAKGIYVGAGGVRTVKEVYAGVNGSVKKVWPAYADYGGDGVQLYNSDLSIVTTNPYSYMITNSSNAGYTLRRNGMFVNTNNGNYATGSAKSGQSGSFDGGANCHWYSIGPIDTRGYHYMVATFRCYQWANGSITYHLIPILGYNSNPDNNPYYGGHYSTGTRMNFGHINTSTAWSTDPYSILFDFTNISLESTYIQIGGQVLYSNSDSGACAGISCSSCILYQTRPSTSVDGSVTF